MVERGVAGCEVDGVVFVQCGNEEMCSMYIRQINMKSHIETEEDCCVQSRLCQLDSSYSHSKFINARDSLAFIISLLCRSLAVNRFMSYRTCFKSCS